jgi:hypothetical protein
MDRIGTGNIEFPTGKQNNYGIQVTQLLSSDN